MRKYATDPRTIARNRLNDLEREIAAVKAAYQRGVTDKLPAAELDSLADQHRKLQAEAEQIRRVLTIGK